MLKPNLDVLPYLYALIPFAIAAIVMRLLKTRIIEAPVRGASAPALTRLYNYISIAAYTIAALVAIYMVTGVPEALYAAIAAAVIMAAPLVPLLLNAYSYLVLVHSGALSVGEHIEVDGVRGTVHSMGLYATTVKTETGDTIAIPNKLLVERVIKKKPLDRRRIDVIIRLHNVPRTPAAVDEAVMKVRRTITEFKAAIRGLESTIAITGYEGDTLELRVRLYAINISAATTAALISRIITALNTYQPDVRIEPLD